MKLPIFLTCFYLSITSFLQGENASSELNLLNMGLGYSSSAITVDLASPIYSEGVLSTTEGGVITGPDIRIQATNIDYTRRGQDGVIISTIKATGNLMLEFGPYVFVGERLEYDFQSHSGVIYQGRAMAEPWFFGGDCIELRSDGSYFIENAFITTSDNIEMDWEISADALHISEDRSLEAQNIKLNIFHVPVLWLPSFNTNLDTIFDSPITYDVRWGGNQGHRFGLIYELFSWEQMKTMLRLDYRLKHGPGGGIELLYRSPDRRVVFEGINYAACDSSIIHPDQTFRYRFQGVGDALLMDDRTTVHLSYDKVSDIDMPTDYNDLGIKLGIAGRTELMIHHQRETMVANLWSHVRINNFQTIKQELPTFATSWLPFDIGSTGVVADIGLKGAYLNFAYGNNQLNVHDYSATRVELNPLFYRHFAISNVNITPQAGGLIVNYGNSPQGQSKTLLMSQLGVNLNTQLWRYYSESYKHVVIPYVDYNYYTMPSVLPHNHYVFDINDGWYRLNLMCFGVAQSLYQKQRDGRVKRMCHIDLYANTFFNNHTFSQAIPKGYLNMTFNTTPDFYHMVNSGWDFIHNEVDHINIRTEWTYNADIAVAAEYRHRSPFDWRKADRTNFILDAFHTIPDLHDSQVSDRRDTFLFSCFVRLHPSWAIQVESRHGWNRRFEPSYTEYEAILLGTLRSAWNMKLMYQHREDDDRVSVYFSIGITRPDSRNCEIVPSLGF